MIPLCSPGYSVVPAVVVAVWGMTLVVVVAVVVEVVVLVLVVEDTVDKPDVPGILAIPLAGMES